MEQSTILVVEDEPIVARDIQLSLERLGYRVPATASSGEEAIRRAKECGPDLVLMDIVLKGSMDGIATAQYLQRQLDVPVVYLTAYGDQQTVQRAEGTAPLGYVMKPFQPTDLQRTVQLALSRAREDRHLRESIRWLVTMVCCVNDAIITTNRAGTVTYMNSAAERLTGWTQAEAVGAGLMALLVGQPNAELDESQNPAFRAMAEGNVVPLEGVVLIGRDYSRRRVQGTAAPVSNESGGILGAVLTLHDAVEEGGAVAPYSDPTPASEEFQGGTSLQGIINLCAWCKRVPDTDGEWYELETYLTEHSEVLFNGGLCPECLDRCFPKEQKRVPDCSQPWREEGDRE
ncbi:hypothetical protein YTPLAS18_29290 [Nitrospira sp.]|nr:hypothetical protein YTPLAS18_29290 [Nitrospira sp.]